MLENNVESKKGAKEAITQKNTTRGNETPQEATGGGGLLQETIGGDGLPQEITRETTFV